MFDLSDPASTRRIEAKSPIPESPEGEAEAENTTHALDMPAAVELHNKLLDSYVRELDRQYQNRNDMAIDEDYYDNIHWDEADAQTVRDRGQVPIVFNVISTAVNWVLGTEKRSRTDFHILPRRKEDSKPAERKSQILKYLSDCNRSPFHRSRGFADAVKVGLGWLEDAYEPDGDGEELVDRYESWRAMLWDSAGIELDLTDARYVYRTKWVDLDIAVAIFPERRGLLELSARDNEPMFSASHNFGDQAMDAAEIEAERANSPNNQINRYARKRVRIIECWYKTPRQLPKMSGGLFSGELYDERSPGHQEQIVSGEAEAVTKQLMRMHCALFTTAGMLWDGPSPYRHNKFPFTPIWGNRRGKDGLPYGMIRGLRDINDDINKRASKAQFLLSARQVLIEADVVEDHDETAAEIARPDAYVVVKSGSLGKNAIKIETGREMAEAEFKIMAHDISMIQTASGVTDENQGRKTNATSGIAIERRQDQGALSTAHFFDNLRFALQVQGEKKLSLVEQFMTDQKQFRITNMRGKPEYITVNDGLPENDIVRSKADYVITEADWRSSMRESAAAELMDLMVKLAPASPQLVMVMLDLVIESTDIHNRDEIVRRVREITGMADPDAEEPTPAQIARQEQAAKDSDLAERMKDAELQRLQSEAMKNQATAEKTKADAARSNLDSIGGKTRGAIDIVADMMAGPQLAAPADELLRDAGYVGRSEKEAALADAQSVIASQPQPQAPPVGVTGAEPAAEAAPTVGLGPAVVPPAQGA